MHMGEPAKVFNNLQAMHMDGDLMLASDYQSLLRDAWRLKRALLCYNNAIEVGAEAFIKGSLMHAEGKAALSIDLSPEGP
jgi:hypothetical protein